MSSDALSTMNIPGVLLHSIFESLLCMVIAIAMGVFWCTINVNWHEGGLPSKLQMDCVDGYVKEAMLAHSVPMCVDIGLSNSPATFQTMMNDIFQDLISEVGL